jgi:hypothetical protein
MFYSFNHFDQFIFYLEQNMTRFGSILRTLLSEHGAHIFLLLTMSRAFPICVTAFALENNFEHYAFIHLINIYNNKRIQSFKPVNIWLV